jgi:hypothetical protein
MVQDMNGWTSSGVTVHLPIYSFGIGGGIGHWCSRIGEKNVALCCLLAKSQCTHDATFNLLGNSIRIKGMQIVGIGGTRISSSTLSPDDTTQLLLLCFRCSILPSGTRTESPFQQHPSGISQIDMLKEQQV